MRIVSLISSGTEILYGLGLGDAVVAVSHECDFPADVAGKPRATRSHVDSSAGSGQIDEQVKALLAAGRPLYDVDVELLSALRPELIVTQSQCDVCAVSYDDVCQSVARRPELAGCRVHSLNPQSLDDVLADIGALGVVTNSLAAAERFRQGLLQRIAAVRAATANIALADRPRVACIEWLEPLMLSGNWLPEMVSLAGGRHDLTEPGRHSPYVSWDALAAYDPQVLLVMPCGFDVERTRIELQSVTARPEWNGLAAVRAGRCHVVDGNAYFNRSGPRLVDSLELLAHLLHPQRFPLPGHISQSKWHTEVM